MFSKKNKAEDKKNVNISTKQFISQTSHNITFQQTTTTQRSQSVYYSSSSTYGTPTGSQISLPAAITGSDLLYVPTNIKNRSRSSSFNVGKTGTDAKPTTSSINLNYQSPYRGISSSVSLNNYKNPPLNLKPTQVQLPAGKTSTVIPSSKLYSAPSQEVPNKKIVVKKTGKFYDNDPNCKIPTYKTSSGKNRGEVLIINNIMFEGNSEREGAKLDDVNLEHMFKQMSFKVTVERNLKKSAMESRIESFSKKSSLKNADISIVVVMSHGTKNETLGDTEIFGTDEKGLLVENILQYFTANKCKYMADKPKIFIFQCCRGNNEQFIQSDARQIKKAVGHADMLIAYSTVPGFVSNRDPKNGTWYIQTLCDVFSQNAHEYHIEELLKIVDVRLSSYGLNVRQISSYESRGFKRCYLHPQ